MAGFWSKLFSNDEKPSSAQTAKDRLKVIVASESGLGKRLSQDKIDQMKKEIMQVVNRYGAQLARRLGPAFKFCFRMALYY